MDRTKGCKCCGRTCSETNFSGGHALCNQCRHIKSKEMNMNPSKKDLMNSVCSKITEIQKLKDTHESQLSSLTSSYESQIKFMKYKISSLEEEVKRLSVFSFDKLDFRHKLSIFKNKINMLPDDSLRDEEPSSPEFELDRSILEKDFPDIYKDVSFMYDKCDIDINYPENKETFKFYLLKSVDMFEENLAKNDVEITKRAFRYLFRGMDLRKKEEVKETYLYFKDCLDKKILDTKRMPTIERIEDIKKISRNYKNRIKKNIKINVSNTVLLFGPPGTGKTELGKYFSEEISGSYFYISASDITSKYQGESEQNVRQIFQNALKNIPSVIFFDEIDALCGTRGDNDSCRRIVTEFLSQMNNLSDGIFIVAATNTPWHIDSAIRRRFRKKLYLKLPNSNSRVNILKNYFQENSNLDDDDYKKLSEITNNFSGFDIKKVYDDLFEEILEADKEIIEKDLIFEYFKKQKPSVSIEDTKRLDEWNISYGDDKKMAETSHIKKLEKELKMLKEKVAIQDIKIKSLNKSKRRFRVYHEDEGDDDGDRECEECEDLEKQLSIKYYDNLCLRYQLRENNMIPNRKIEVDMSKMSLLLKQEDYDGIDLSHVLEPIKKDPFLESKELNDTLIGLVEQMNKIGKYLINNKCVSLSEYTPKTKKIDSCYQLSLYELEDAVSKTTGFILEEDKIAVLK